VAETIDQAAGVARRDPMTEQLAPESLLWLAALPERLRPEVLPVRFPHMANALARAWNDPATLRVRLDELLIDRRGNRHGLPIEVAEELASLKDYFETVLHPVPQTVWDEVAARKRSV
jgi:hypothetical protein